MKMSYRPFCLVCKMSTEEADRKFNVELDFTPYTKTRLREFLNNLLNFSVKFTTLNVCFSCFEQINELDVLQEKTKQAREKLIKKFSSDIKAQKEHSYKFETQIKEEDEDGDDIDDFLECDDEETEGKAQKTFELSEDESLNNEDFPIVSDRESDEDYVEGNAREKKKKTKKPDRNKQQESPKKKNEKKRTDKFECLDCKMEFQLKEELKSHVATHKPFICEICGQGYRNKSAFEIHVGMHNGIHPFTCPHCQKTFTQKGSLQRHLNMHTGETPFQCDLCGKRFIHHSSFKVHQMHHSGQKDHKCQICNLALMTGSHLRRHMRVHTGEKRYHCEICGKRFAERYNYVVHQKVHEKHGGAIITKRVQTRQDSDQSKLKKDEAVLEQEEQQPQQPPQQQYFEASEFTITPLYGQENEIVYKELSAPQQNSINVLHQKVNSSGFSTIPPVPRIVTPGVPVWSFNT